MSVAHSPEFRGPTGERSRGLTNHLTFSAEFTKKLPSSSPRFGSLSHHSFFSRHNPHPHRVRHIQGEWAHSGALKAFFVVVVFSCSSQMSGVRPDIWDLFKSLIDCSQINLGFSITRTCRGTLGWTITEIWRQARRVHSLTYDSVPANNTLHQMPRRKCGVDNYRRNVLFFF